MRESQIEAGEDAYLDEDQKILKRLRKGQSKQNYGDPFLEMELEEKSLQA